MPETKLTNLRGKNDKIIKEVFVQLQIKYVQIEYSFCVNLYREGIQSNLFGYSPTRAVFSRAQEAGG